MDTNWQFISEPDVGRWGISSQHVLLTSRGAFTTGYWVKKERHWLVDGLLLHNEVVIAWLEGLRTGVMENAENNSKNTIYSIKEDTAS